MLFQDIEAILSERGKDWGDVKGMEINKTPLSFEQFKAITSKITVFEDYLNSVSVIGSGWWICGECKWDSWAEAMNDYITLAYEEFPIAREPVTVNTDEFVRKLIGNAYQIVITHGPVKRTCWYSGDTVSFYLENGEWYDITFSIDEDGGKKYYGRVIEDREGNIYIDSVEFDVFNEELSKEDYAQWTADNWTEVAELITMTRDGYIGNWKEYANKV